MRDSPVSQYSAPRLQAANVRRYNATFSNPTTDKQNMALSSKALQQKRAKKAAKRKETRKSAPQAANSGKAAEWLAAANAPIADVYAPENLFEEGMGSVWFSRLLPDGRYALSVFLVDVYCLGVKSTLYAVLEPERYRTHQENFLHISEEKLAPCEPAYARKLVEASVAYAKELGFAPHVDYKFAKLLFGDVDASASDAYFTFGRDGNPYYVAGPGDSPAEQRRVLKQLEKLHKDPYALLTRGLND
jgi:hypothetical protein